MREIFGILFSLVTFENFLSNHEVDLFTDNQGAAKIVSRGSMKPWLHYIALRIHSFALQRNIKLNPFWIPREHNTHADVISKFIDWDDWSITKGLCKYLQSKWGICTIDLFANHNNTKCEKFYSHFWCPGTSGVNAFNFSWKGELCWCVPPFSLIIEVLKHFKSGGSKMILIVPEWQSAPFFPLLHYSSDFACMISEKMIFEKSYRFIIPKTQRNLAFASSHYNFSLCALKMENCS